MVKFRPIKHIYVQNKMSVYLITLIIIMVLPTVLLLDLILLEELLQRNNERSAVYFKPKKIKLNVYSYAS